MTKRTATGESGRRSDSRGYLRLASQLLLILLAVLPWIIMIGVQLRNTERRSTLLSRTPTGSSRGPAKDHAAHDKPAHGEPAAELPSPDPLRRANALMEAGNLEDAADGYEVLLDQQSPESQLLMYRLAVCRELLGDHTEALALYRQLAGSDTGPTMRSAALLGQARVHAGRGQLELADPLLSTLVLAPVRAGAPRPQLTADVAHLAAQTQAQRLLRGGPSDLLQSGGLANALPYWNVEGLLKLVAQSTDNDPPLAELHVALRFGESPTDVQIRGRADEQPVRHLVQALAALLDLSLHDSPPVRQLLAGRTAAMHTSGIAAGSALDALLYPLGLTWELRSENELFIQPVQATPDGNPQASQLAVTRRALHDAVTAHPNHHLAPLSYLLLGNLAVASVEWDAGLAWYQQAMRQHPLSPYRAELWMNQAKVYMLQGQLDAAREALYHVVDGSRGHPLEGVAYLFLGRLLLEEGETHLAIRPLLRAASLSQSSIQAASATSLASAYILTGNPHAAALALQEYSTALVGSHQHDVAAYLSSLARYEASRSQPDHLMQGRALVASATHVRPKQFFGDYGYLLIGRGLTQLGLYETVIQSYETALAQEPLPDAIGGKMALQLASLYRQTGRPELAAEWLDRLAATAVQPWARQAEIELVTLRYEEGDHDWCLQQCEQMLADTDDQQERSRLLAIMGRIYEDRRDHFRAALCFAGLLPTEDDEQLPVTAPNSSVIW